MAGNGEKEKRIAGSAADLVFFTDTGGSDYPIYLTNSREVWLKARPRAPIAATFFVKRVAEVGDVSHELYDVAVQAITEVTKSEPETVRLEITYEVYRGDVEEAIGEAKAYAVLILSHATPFRRDRGRAWAIGFDWKKRAAAKYPGIASYMYLKDFGSYLFHVRLCIKLPVVTQELERLFDIAVSATQAGVASELEQQVEALRRAIEQKKEELNTLQEQLQQLEMKMQLERMKREVV